MTNITFDQRNGFKHDTFQIGPLSVVICFLGKVSQSSDDIAATHRLFIDGLQPVFDRNIKLIIRCFDRLFAGESKIGDCR